jgi:SAM-dependent methyltransferase
MTDATLIDRHNRSQRTYFEERLSPRMVPRRSRYLERHLDELVRFAALRPTDRILEVGCGMGRYTLLLADRGYHVEGNDLSPLLLERLRSYDGSRERIPLHAFDIASPPSELHGAYDAVVGLFMLHHLHDLELSFRGLAKLLRPEGRLAFLEPSALTPFFYAQIALTRGMTWRGDGGVARMRPGVVLPALRAAGLVGERSGVFGFFPPALADTGTGAAIERTLERARPLRPFRAFALFGARAAAVQ